MGRIQSVTVPGLFAGLLIAVPGPVVHAAPITTNTALPVAKGNVVWREQFIQRERSDDGPMDREVSVSALVSVLGYGVTSDFALFGLVPYFFDREMTARQPMMEDATRSTNGFGDLELFARYTVVQRDGPGQTLRVSPIFGIKAPTGQDDDRDSQGRLPRPLQTGTGTWDGFVGVVGTFQTLDYQLDTQLLYRAHGRKEKFSPGDAARFDASIQYRLWPRELTSGTPGFVYGVLESTVEHRRRNVVEGVTDADSGGSQWLLSPGLQYVGRRWILESAVQLPVASNPRGDAIADDRILRAGFRFQF